MTDVNLLGCEEETLSDQLTKLQSMLSLRTLVSSASCGARAVDAEAAYGLTTLLR